MIFDGGEFGMLKAKIAKFSFVWAVSVVAVLFTGMGNLSASDKVVTIWHTEPNYRTRSAMQDIISDYEELNPGIRIEQEAIGWSSLLQKLQAALAAGAPPDASHGGTGLVLSLSEAGLLRPLDDLVESIGEDNIFEVVRRISIADDGHYYGLPHCIGADAIVYRKDLYRRAGLDHEIAPRNWDEWLAQLKKLTVDIDGDGTIDQYGLGLAGEGQFINEEVLMWTGSNGGRMYDPDGRPTFTERPMIEMLEFYKKVSDCCLWPGWMNHSYPETFTMLAQGKVASIMGWGRGAIEFEKYAPEVVANGDIGVFDSKPIGPSGTEFMTQLDGEQWMVFKHAKYPDEALDFLKFFYDHNNYRRYAQSVPIHLLPIDKTLYEDVAYSQQTPEFDTWKFWVQIQQKFIAEGNSRPVIEWDDLTLPYLSEVAGSGILIDMVSDVITERRTPQEAAERAQKLTERLIEDMGYRRW
jgi:multiple sugar transport system substrate-binding protein